MTPRELTEAVEHSLSSGAPLHAGPLDIATASGVDDLNLGAYLALPLSDGPTTSLVQLAMLTPLLPGCSLLGFVPFATGALADTLFSASLTLRQVEFALFPGCDRISDVGLTLAFDPAYQLKLFGSLTISLDSLALGLTAPGSQTKPNVQLNGALILDSGFVLKATVALPDFRASIGFDDAANPPKLHDFLGTLGVNSDLFGKDEFSISFLDFSIELLPPSGPPNGALQLVVVSMADKPVLNQCGFMLAYDGETWSGGANALLTPFSTSVVTFGVRLEYSNKSWSVAGNLDIPTTLYKMNPAAPPDKLTLKDLLRQASTDLPGLLDDIAIEDLSIEADFAGSKLTGYSIATQMEIDWTLGSARYRLDTTLNYIHGYTQVAASQGELKGVFDLDGFQVILSTGWGNYAEFSAVVPNWDGWKLSGTYRTAAANGLLTLNVVPPAGATIADLLARFVAVVTKQPATTLSEPWDTLLGFALPAGLTIAVDFDRGRYEASIEKLNISLLGLTLDSFTLSYGPDPKDKSKPPKRKFSIKVDYTGALPGLQHPLEWDPTDPSTAPTVAGLGPSKLEILTVAAGQYVQFPQTPTDPESAIRQLNELLQAEAGALPRFDAASGWTLGLHLLFMGQADVQLAFCDPNLYALHFTVKPDAVPTGAKGSPYLKALAGLSAEVLYQKLNATSGVFKAEIVPPSSIRDIDLGMFRLHLPSLAFAVYTDGGFSFDVGFPHGGDFSRSASLLAGEFSGAGGVYFAQLNGATAPDLPKVSPGVNGGFGTAIEMGLGLRIGLYYGFTRGPLTASLSASIAGVFQGVFAPFTNYGDQSTTEYYSVTAMVIVTGTIRGEVNFVLIKVSVLVSLSAQSLIEATAGEPVKVAVRATLHAEASLTIDFIFFTVDYSFSFSISFEYAATLGSGSRQPWKIAAGLSSGVVRLEPPPTPPLRDFFIPLPKAPVLEQALYPVPVLTKSSNNGLLYTPQFLLDTESTSNVKQMMHYILAWFLLAQHQALDPEDAIEDYLDLPVTLDLLDSLKTYLHTGDGHDCVTLTNLTTLFGTSIKLRLEPLSASRKNITPFPRLPALQTGLYLSYEPYPHHDRKRLPCPALPAQDEAVDGLMGNYIVLIGHAMVSEAFSLFEKKKVSSMPFHELSRLLDPGADPDGNATANAINLVSRFMLHGTQFGSPAVPLYQATGQMFLPEPRPGCAFVFSFRVDQNPYGLFSFSGKPIELSSLDNHPIVYSADQVSSYKEIDPKPSIFELRTMPQTVEHVRRFHLIRATKLIQPQNLVCLFMLPGELRRAMPTLPSKATRAGEMMTIEDEKRVKLAASQYDWATCISFQVQQDPRSPELPLYTIVRLQGADLAMLTELYRVLNKDPQKLWGIELFVGAQTGTATRYDVDDSTVFIYQQNRSNDAAPPSPGDAPSVDSSRGLLSLGRLLASALTNTGGYSLYIGNATSGLPASLFDASGLATLSFVLGLNTSSSDTLRCANAVRLKKLTDAQSQKEWFAWSGEFAKVSRPCLQLGTVGFLPVLEYPKSGTTSFASTLNSLFSLVGLRSWLRLADGRKMAFPFTVVAPYMHPGEQGDERSYRQTIDLFAASGNDVLALYSAGSSADSLPWPSELIDPENDPYQFVGAALAGEAILVDVYGNRLDHVKQSTQKTIAWSDPLLGPLSWPGFSIGYRIEKKPSDSEPRLRIKMRWKAPSDGLTTAQRSTMMLDYGRIYHQLCHTRTTARLSLLDRDFDLRDKLKEGVNEILNTLWASIFPECELTELALALPGEASSYSTTILIPLTLKIKMELSDAESKLQVESDIAPLHRDEEVTRVSVRAFARHFEEALRFLGAKLMLSGSSATEPAALWYLNQGPDGMQVTISAANSKAGVGYTPKPLHLQTCTRAGIDPGPYNDRLLYPADRKTNRFYQDAPVSCTNLDADGTMNLFLSALDTMLSPGNAVAASRVGIGVLDQMLEAKQLLAQNLSKHVIALDREPPDGADPALPVAAERYRQNQLRAASDFYTVDTVAVYRVDVENPFAENFVLFGQLSEAIDNDVTLSPFHCEVVRSSGFAPISVSLRHKGVVDEIAMPEQLRITAFHMNIEKVEIQLDGKGSREVYSQGTWLQYAIAPTARLAVPAQTLSLPLRACPSPVKLLSQSFAPTRGSTVQEMPVSETMLWDYSIGYQRHLCAQDSLLVEIAANGGPATVETFQSGPDLCDALALFQTVYPKILPELPSNLPALAVQGPLAGSTMDAIAAFAALADAIASFSGKLPGLSGGFRFRSGARKIKFEIVEGPASLEDNAWEMAIHPVEPSTGIAALLPEIAGYKTVQVSSAQPALYRFEGSDGTLLTASKASAISARTLRLQGCFNILDVQTAQATISTERNKYLLPSSPSTFPSAFQYATAPVTYPHALEPMLRIVDEVSLVPSTQSAVTLNDAFTLLVRQLLTAQQASPGKTVSLDLHLWFDMPLLLSNREHGTSLPPVSFPIGFVTGESLPVNPAADDKSVTDCVSGVVQAIVSSPIWTNFSPNDLPWASASIRVTASLFTGALSNQTASFALSGLFLPASACRPALESRNLG